MTDLENFTTMLARAEILHTHRRDCDDEREEDAVVVVSISRYPGWTEFVFDDADGSLINIKAGRMVCRRNPRRSVP